MPPRPGNNSWPKKGESHKSLLRTHPPGPEALARQIKKPPKGDKEKILPVVQNDNCIFTIKMLEYQYNLLGAWASTPPDNTGPDASALGPVSFFRGAMADKVFRTYKEQGEILRCNNTLCVLHLFFLDYIYIMRIISIKRWSDDLPRS